MHARKILLVEDDPLDAELTTATLQSIPISNEIVHFEDGEEVLHYLYSKGEYANNQFEVPALIILDIKMPKVDGIQVLKKIKSDERLKGVPTVILTSSKEQPDVIESYGLGANAYVVKPVNTEQFNDAVKTLGLFWALVNHVN